MRRGPAELAPLDASTLVEASAGTGKTHTITTHFVRGLLELELEASQILVVTYTKAATAELRVRCRKRIAEALAFLDRHADPADALSEVVSAAVARVGRDRTEELLRRALRDMDQTSIFTIHGFCQRLLQDYPLDFGVDFEIEVAEDTSSEWRDLAIDFWTTDLYDRPPWLVKALAKKRIDVDHLTRLARIATTPGVTLLGPEPGGPAEEAATRVATLHEQAAALWAAHRPEVWEILKSDAGLNRRSYKVSTIAKWPPELDDFFGEDGFQTPPDCLAKLTPAQMIVKSGHEKPKHAFFDACGRLQEAHEELAPMLAYEVFAFQARFVEFVRQMVVERREESAVLSFDDLLTLVYAPWDPAGNASGSVDADRIARKIAEAYPLALVDEFQDTDSIQYGIFKGIYGSGRVVYVGDPKQAIYAFRGADVFSYLGAAKDIGDRKHELRTNRRSDPDLVRAVNTLFSRPRDPFILDGIAFEPALAHEPENRTSLAPAMEVVLLEDADQLRSPIEVAVAPVVANEIAHLLGSGASIGERPVDAGDVAVLCRSNKQALAVTKALRARSIPASLDGDSSVLHTEVASDLLAVLEATLMPGDGSGIRRALLTSLIGTSPKELSTMDDECWAGWVAKFRGWNATWHDQGVVRFLEDMLSDSAAETRLATRITAQRDLTDLAHLEELLMRGEREQHRDPVALMQWFRRLDEGTSNQGAVASEDLQQRPDAQSGAVRVSTIHKSKGLEYGIVFIPFTWNDASLFKFERDAVRFHDEEGRIRIDLGSDAHAEHLRRSEREAYSEAIRLLYVAVTRARHHCVLFWGQANRWKSSALAHLLHGRERVDSIDAEAMRADLDALATASAGTMGWRTPRPESERAPREEAPGPELRALPAIRSFDPSRRIASFTSLTGLHEKIPAAGTDSRGPGAPALLFPELPAGARTGLFLHAILERVDTSDLTGAEARVIVREQLRVHGFDSTLEEAVLRDLSAVCETPLIGPEAGPRLVDLPRGKQLRELEFILRADRADLPSLVQLLKEHRAPAGAPEYPRRLAELGAPSIQRFLRGYIDLVFEWKGRWYVADYKSNTLPAYDQAAVAESVQREHYLLQGQLYSAAARRYLKQRLPDFDEETQWGGALFLFLRGMRGPNGRGSVFFDRQSPELLRAVDRWLGGVYEPR